MRPKRASTAACAHASTESGVGDVGVRVIDGAELAQLGDGLAAVHVVDIGDRRPTRPRAGSARRTPGRCPGSRR